MPDAIGVVDGLLHGLAGQVVQAVVQGTDLPGVFQEPGRLLDQLRLAALDGAVLRELFADWPGELPFQTPDHMVPPA